MKPTETIQLFDAFLLARDLSLEAVVVGGTALAFLGVISRETRDCDVLYPELSDEIRHAALAFAAERRAANNYIADDWLNNGPLIPCQGSARSLVATNPSRVPRPSDHTGFP